MILMFASFITGAISAALVIPLVYSVVKAFLGIGPSGEVQVAPPIQEIIHTDGGQYRSEENYAPKLTGKLLYWFCNFLSTPFGRKWVLEKLMRKNHLFDSRKRYLPEAATFYPTPPFVPFPEESVREDGRSEKEEIETLMYSSAHKNSSDSDGFVFPTILDYLDSYRSGRVTPAVVAERIIESIHASDSLSPPLRAFVQWNETEIRKQALESTRRYSEKDNIRPLEGVPVGVKENIQTKPYIIRVGCGFIPIAAQTIANEEESEVVVKLRQAGAVIIGVTNLHEIGIGGTGSNVNDLHLTARNPYDTDRYPGGSSSGSAAAVASGLVPMALGTDGGGSIRVPSSFSGLVGLKATFGRVTEGRMIASASTVTNIGPICTSVPDTALSYLLLAGCDPNEPTSVQQGPVTIGDYLTPKESVRGLKVGIYRDWFNHCDPEVKRVCQQSLQWIVDAGAELVDLHIPELNATFIAHITTFLTEISSTYKYDFYEHYRDFNTDTIQYMIFGDSFTAADYTMAARQRTRAIQVMKSVFSQVDVLVTPTTGRTAVPIEPSHLSHGCVDVNSTGKIVRFTVLGNLTGVPGIAIPVGYDSNNLPVSLQLMANWWREDLLFRLAAQIEKRVMKRKPKIFYDILQL